MTSSGLDVGATAVVALLAVAAFAAIMACWWRIFSRMGQSGWSGIVPLLNAHVVFRLRDREWWWVLLLLVPCVGIVVGVVFMNDVARLFGKGIGWTVGLVLLPIVFVPSLALGDHRYAGPDERIL